jgi:hypothetical protein
VSRSYLEVIYFIITHSLSFQNSVLNQKAKGLGGRDHSVNFLGHRTGQQNNLRDKVRLTSTCGKLIYDSWNFDLWGETEKMALVIHLEERLNHML